MRNLPSNFAVICRRIFPAQALLHEFFPEVAQFQRGSQAIRNVVDGGSHRVDDSITLF
jgi:hypothetical protein